MITVTALQARLLWVTKCSAVQANVDLDVNKVTLQLRWWVYWWTSDCARCQLWHHVNLPIRMQINSDHLFSLLADISVMEVARPCPIITDTSWTTRYISFFCCRAFGDQGACFALLLLSGDDGWTIKDLKRSTNPTWIFSLGKLNVHQICCQDHL